MSLPHSAPTHHEEEMETVVVEGGEGEEGERRGERRRRLEVEEGAEGEDGGEGEGEGEVEGEGVQHVFTNGVTVGYTYDAFFVSDGRSKRRHSLDSADGSVESSSASSVSSKANGGAGGGRGAGGVGKGELRSSSSSSSPASSSSSRQRYTCGECGKDYATSSNLSRHKQTHRSLDSTSAKKCPHCPKVYVSMPALSMHVLTHDLKYTCPTCGKHFSRPWLLQVRLY
jgi:DNA-directed RNA polymerase subunit RPC12/RpoP